MLRASRFDELLRRVVSFELAAKCLSVQAASRYVRVVAVQARQVALGHLADQVGILAERFLGAAPARIVHEIDVGPAHDDADAAPGLADAARVVDARLVAGGRADDPHDLRVPAFAQAEHLGKLRRRRHERAAARLRVRRDPQPVQRLGAERRGRQGERGTEGWFELRRVSFSSIVSVDRRLAEPLPRAAGRDPRTDRGSRPGCSRRRARPRLRAARPLSPCDRRSGRRLRRCRPVRSARRSSPHPNSSGGASSARTASLGVDFTPLVAARRAAMSTPRAAAAAAVRRGLAGTFAPFCRASDRPIAIACLRLFTARVAPLAGLERAALRAPHGAADALLRGLAVPRTLRATTSCHCLPPSIVRRLTVGPLPSSKIGTIRERNPWAAL